MKYPRLWENKLSKKRVRVMPWWETVKDGEIEEVNELGRLLSDYAKLRDGGKEKAGD